MPGVFGGVLRIRDNIVAGRSGIDLGEFSAFAASVVVEANDIWASNEVGIRANGALLPQASVLVLGQHGVDERDRHRGRWHGDRHATT